MSAPKLRFKEFSGEWEGKKLGELIEISSASRVYKEQWTESGVAFFRTSDVVAHFKNTKNEKAFISHELFEQLSKKSGKIKKDDLLITGGGSIGIPYLVKNNGPLYFKDADLLWFKSSGIIEGNFLYNFLISSKFSSFLGSISHTGTISHFTIEQAKKTPISIPSKPEQTKIATFLTAVDEKISQLSQKQELLTQYKKGMMQKLFSQQVRFKADDGSEFGEWEEKLLNDITQITMGSSPKSENYNENQLGLPLLQGNADIKNRLSHPRIFTSEITKKCNIGDILLSVRAPVGFVALSKHNACIGRGLASIRAKTNINQGFIYQVLLLKETKWASLSQGSTFESVNSEQIKNLNIHLPTLPEQTKIANFLSAIDQKIDTTTQQLEQAKQWKKGLLQQMFA